MPKTRSRLVRYGFLAGLTAAVFAGGAFVLTLGSDDLATVAAEQAVNTGPDKVAIKGYDPVAYFTEGRAVRGSPEFEHDWHGATWRLRTAK